MLSFLQMMEAKFEVRYYCTGDKTQTRKLSKGRSAKKRCRAIVPKGDPLDREGFEPLSS